MKPNLFKVEGVDYTPEGIEEFRQSLIDLRAQWFFKMGTDPDAADYVVVFTHIIAYLAYLKELIEWVDK